MKWVGRRARIVSVASLLLVVAEAPRAFAQESESGPALTSPPLGSSLDATPPTLLVEDADPSAAAEPGPSLDPGHDRRRARRLRGFGIALSIAALPAFMMVPVTTCATADPFYYHCR